MIIKNFVQMGCPIKTRLFFIYSILGLLLFLVSLPARASFTIQYSLNYHTDSDSAATEPFEYSRMNNMVYLAATLDKKQKFYFGFNVLSWSKSATKGSGDTESDISLLEMGPRFQYFLNDLKNWYISLVWHPYAKGTRTISGESQNISGSSYLGSFGYHLKITKKFHLGASVNYHSVSISESVVSNEAATISHSYSTIMPMIEVSLRFR